MSGPDPDADHAAGIAFRDLRFDGQIGPVRRFEENLVSDDRGAVAFAAEQSWHPGAGEFEPEFLVERFPRKRPLFISLQDSDLVDGICRPVGAAGEKSGGNERKGGQQQKKSETV